MKEYLRVIERNAVFSAKVAAAFMLASIIMDLTYYIIAGNVGFIIISIIVGIVWIPSCLYLLGIIKINKNKARLVNVSAYDQNKEYTYLNINVSMSKAEDILEEIQKRLKTGVNINSIAFEVARDMKLNNDETVMAIINSVLILKERATNKNQTVEKIINKLKEKFKDDKDPESPIIKEIKKSKQKKDSGNPYDFLKNEGI